MDVAIGDPEGVIDTAKTKTKGRTDQRRSVEGVSPADRTLVIVLAQVVTILALLILWSILRARRSGAEAGTP